jgi:hypothetical protein
MQTYLGSCHCGEVRYEINADVKSAIECNCSICSRKGTILTFVSPEQFKLVSGKDSMQNYQFYKKALHHQFCKICGVTSFIYGTSPKGESMYAINARTLENFDLKSLSIQQVDGKSF